MAALSLRKNAGCMSCYLNLLIKAAKEYQADNVSQLAAALAYYTVFSMAPLLVIAIAIAGYVFGDQAVQGELVAAISEVTDHQTAQTVQQLIAKSSNRGSGGMAGLLGLTMLLYGATRVFVVLKDALNTVFDVPPSQSPIIHGFLRDRLLSFLMLVLIGFLLMAALISRTVLELAIQWSAERLPLPGHVLSASGTAVSIAATTILFASLFKVLPDRKIGWRQVLVGAFATALLYAVGETLIRVYLSTAAVSSTFGAAASIAVILIWVNFSASILLFGAELTQVYAESCGESRKEQPRR